MPKIAIVYLDRWGNPPRFPRAFLNSLKDNPAGSDYDLIWQLKGYPGSWGKSFAGGVFRMSWGRDTSGALSG